MCLELQNRKTFNYAGNKRKQEHSEDLTQNGKSLYDQLMAVDPDRANQLHPNNTRKISRSLQIYHTTGETHTSLMSKQKCQTGSSNLSKYEELL